MSILSKILIVLVAIEFLFIFYLETIVTTSERTAKVFKMNVKELNRSSVNTLFRNQGVYNGLIALMLVYAAFLAGAGHEIATLLLTYIVAVAAYGAVSSDKSIFLKQGGLAILALISLSF